MDTFKERLDLLKWYDYFSTAAWAFLALVCLTNGWIVPCIAAISVAISMFERIYYKRHRDYLLECLKKSDLVES